MAIRRDILFVSTSVVAPPPTEVRTTLTPELDESPSIVPPDPIKSENTCELTLQPEQARVRFEAFRDFALGRRRRELSAKASARSQAGLDNNVQQLATALNLTGKSLGAAGWSIQGAIELARNTSTRPSELNRASKLLVEFDRIKPATTPAKQFGTRVKEILALASLKPLQAATVTGLAKASIYRWMSENFLPKGNKANRTAAVALENLVNKSGYLQPLLRPAWKTVDRPAHISVERWRPILTRLRRGGHCDLEGAELSHKIEELLTTPSKPQRAPYRFPKNLEKWPSVPRSEIEKYQRLAQLRSEPNWNKTQ
jgi:hypothetical protein